MMSGNEGRISLASAQFCKCCGTQLEEYMRFCPECGRSRDGDSYPEMPSLSIDYTNRCGNCQSEMEPDDLYCRICGTKRGLGAFKPYENHMQVVYGPMPVKRKHKCRSCGYTWKTILMLDRQEHCPRCGGSAPAKELSCRWSLFS